QRLKVAAVHDVVLALLRLKKPGYTCEPRIIDQVPESLQSDLTLADMGVPVPVAPERILRVVEVDGLHANDADCRVELSHHLGIPLRGAEVIPGSEDMTGIDADAHSILRLDLVDDGRQFLERPSERRPLPSRRFEERLHLEVRQ